MTEIPSKIATESVMTLVKFVKKNWEGVDRYRRIELDNLSKTLNLTLNKDDSNKNVYDRIYLHLMSNFTVNEFKKKSWENVDRYRRIELDSISKILNLILNETDSNQNVYDKIVFHLSTFSLKSTLYDFQIKTVTTMLEFESRFDGGFLLLEAGLGKSISSINLILKTNIKTLIIVPSGLVDNWVNEFIKHTNITRNSIIKYYGPNRNELIELDALVYITSYAIVSREFDGETFYKDTLFDKVKFKRILLDEAHYIRNAKITTAKAVLHLSEINLNCKKWVITATPIFNSYKDTFSYFKFLQLEGIDTKRDFTNQIVKNIFGLKTLNEWIHKYSIKYTKEIVLRDLKKKKLIDIHIDFSPIEKEFYDSLYNYSQKRMKSLIKKIKRKSTEGSLKSLLHSNIMVFILRLKQACDSPWLILNKMKRLQGSDNLQTAINRLGFFNDTKNIVEECSICYDAMTDRINVPCGHKLCSGCLDKMERLNIMNCHICRQFVEETEYVSPIQVPEIQSESELEIVSSKINKLMEIVNEKINKNEKVVIVSQWVSYLDIIKKVFKKKKMDIESISLQGSVPLHTRTELIKSFQTNKNIKICFISLNSSAEGITLTAANNLILVDHWWAPAKTLQVCERIHRIGQIKDVTIYKLYINDTIEQKIQKRLVQKESISKLCLNRWIIKNITEYNADWITEEIKLIERPPSQQEKDVC